MKMLKRALLVMGILLGVSLILETGVRVIIDLPAHTDFYSSIRKDEIAFYGDMFKLKVNAGPDWIHIGWIADPDRQRYAVFRVDASGETLLGETRFGSYLAEHLSPSTAYRFRVKSSDGDFDLAAASVTTARNGASPCVPYIASRWRPLFRPSKTGDYINDHTVFRSGDGAWHVIGITAFGPGDYSKEKYFAHGVSRSFPPPAGEMMRELDPVADFGRVAWAPHVVFEGRYRMWYSPHRVYAASSTDGYGWREESGLSFLPFHKQFRDPMVLKVADGQWLMYATARDGYYSTVDAYQSFDLDHWQYIGPAMETGFGAERAGAQASTESPFVLAHNGRYFLSFTCNNDSFFWNPILLSLGVWLDRESYNETPVLESANPYSFGTYRGKKNTPALSAVLEAHAPEYVAVDGRYYITTAGWPWMASLTRGEVAVAELGWREK